MKQILALWFGQRTSVSRGAYLATGLGLMALRYLIDNLIYLAGGGEWAPLLTYLNPAFSVRWSMIEHLQRGEGAWIVAALGLAALPFIWVGVSMSMRRAADAGWSRWLGLLFFVPVVNYIVIAALCVAPSIADSNSAERQPSVAEGSLVAPVLSATLATMAIAVGLVLVSVMIFGRYGSALFVGTPFVMGVVAARMVHARGYRGLKTSLAVAALAVTVAAGSLLLFALEGVICITMAAPLAFGLTFAGAIVGDSMSQNAQRESGSARAMVLALPLLAALPGTLETSPPVHPVTTSIEVNAPPEIVWNHVLSFKPLEKPKHWLFRAGIAAPLRARIDGSGVGAVRHCEFTTGAFVEPITVFKPPTHLAFDVTSHPPSMREMGLWPVTHAPHVESA
ncbi:MAG TPA: hypothetical protein DCQ06_06835, partial [Myxococcales bacterium]|nr:hypothetical protein [Myxococcales bacterium]